MYYLFKLSMPIEFIVLIYILWTSQTFLNVLLRVTLKISFCDLGISVHVGLRFFNKCLFLDFTVFLQSIFTPL